MPIKSRGTKRTATRKGKSPNSPRVLNYSQSAPTPGWLKTAMKERRLMLQKDNARCAPYAEYRRQRRRG